MATLSKSLRPFLTVLTSLCLAAGAGAQTTGVAGLNRLEIYDYGLSAFVSPPPCTMVTSSVSDPALSLRVCSQTAGQTAVLLVGTSVTSPVCTPCAVAFPASACAIPFSTCSGTSNQSLDVVFSPALMMSFTTGALGPMGACRRLQPIVYSSLPDPMALIGKQISVQMVLLSDPCSHPSTLNGELFTNAFEVLFTP